MCRKIGEKGASIATKSQQYLLAGVYNGLQSIFSWEDIYLYIILIKTPTKRWSYRLARIAAILSMVVAVLGYVGITARVEALKDE